MPTGEGEAVVNVRSEALHHTCFHSVELRAGPGNAVISSWEHGKVLPSSICSTTLCSLSKLPQVMATSTTLSG